MSRAQKSVAGVVSHCPEKKKTKPQLVPILVVSCWVERTKRCHRSCCSNSNISPETLWELSELCKSVQAVLSPVSLSGRHLETWEMPVRFFDWEKTPKITFAAQEVWQDAVAGLCRLSDSISVACLPFTRNILIVTAQMFPQSPLWASGLFADKCSTKESKKKKKKKRKQKRKKKPKTAIVPKACSVQTDRHRWRMRQGWHCDSAQLRKMRSNRAENRPVLQAPLHCPTLGTPGHLHLQPAPCPDIPNQPLAHQLCTGEH